MFKECPFRSTHMPDDMFAGHRVLAFDLETTGISTQRDRIVQLALIGTDKDGTPIHFEYIVNPTVPIPFEASQIHGIYDSDVRGQPRFSQIVEEVFNLMDGAVIIGHNVRQFDLQMLSQECLRTGRLAPRPFAIMDTLELVRRLKVPRPHNLGSLCTRHSVDLTAAHTAGADAAATMLLFWRLSIEHAPSFRRPINELERWIVHGDSPSDVSALGRGLNDLEPVDMLGKIRRDGEHFIVAFGRHKGKHVLQINEEDPNYMGWLLTPKGVECAQTRERLATYIAQHQS